MKIILDEGLPQQLKSAISGHEVKTVPELGCAGVRNVDLIQYLSEHGCDVFVTTSRNLAPMMGMSGTKITVVILDVKSNRFSALEPLIPKFREILEKPRPGQSVRITA